MEFISVVAFFATIIFGIMALVSVVKKNGKGKRNGWIALISFVIFIAAAVSMPVEEEVSTKPVKEKEEPIEIKVGETVTISTLDKEVTIRGKVSNIDKLTIEGEETPIEKESFSKVIQLKDDQKTVEIVGVTDSKETKEVVNIKRKALEPKLTVTSKEESKSKQYELKGETEPSADVKLFKDGKEISKTTAGKDGKFNFSKLDTAKAGEYKYTVEVSKEGYNTTAEDHVVLRSLSKEEEQQQVKDNAITIDYKQLEKNKNKHKGEYAKFKGQIVQIMEDGDYTVMRLAVAQNQWGWDGNAIVYVEYAGTTEFVQDDVVTVYGLMMGEHSYESTAGWNISVPSMFAEIVE